MHFSKSFIVSFLIFGLTYSLSKLLEICVSLKSKQSFEVLNDYPSILKFNRKKLVWSFKFASSG